MTKIAAFMLTLQVVKDYFGPSFDNDQAFVELIFKNTLNLTIFQILCESGELKGDGYRSYKVTAKAVLTLEIADYPWNYQEFKKYLSANYYCTRMVFISNKNKAEQKPHS